MPTHKSDYFSTRNVTSEAATAECQASYSKNECKNSSDVVERVWLAKHVYQTCPPRVIHYATIARVVGGSLRIQGVVGGW